MRIQNLNTTQYVYKSNVVNHNRKNTEIHSPSLGVNFTGKLEPDKYLLYIDSIVDFRVKQYFQRSPIKSILDAGDVYHALENKLLYLKGYLDTIIDESTIDNIFPSHILSSSLEQKDFIFFKMLNVPTYLQADAERCHSKNSKIYNHYFKEAIEAPLSLPLDAQLEYYKGFYTQNKSIMPTLQSDASKLVSDSLPIIEKIDKHLQQSIDELSSIE